MDLWSPVNRLLDPPPRPVYSIKESDHAETGLTYMQCFAVVQVFPGNRKAVLSFLCVLYKVSLTDCILWNARRILQRHQENCIHIHMYITLLGTNKGKLFTVWSKPNYLKWVYSDERCPNKVPGAKPHATFVWPSALNQVWTLYIWCVRHDKSTFFKLICYLN